MQSCAVHGSSHISGAPLTRAVRASLCVLFAVLALLPASAVAQGFDAERFLQQCLRLEEGGDHVSARESCLGALQVEPNDPATLLALARIEFRLGETASAENRLLLLRARADSAEPSILLAEITLERGQLDMAEANLASASLQLQTHPDPALQARHAYLTGRVAEQRGQLRDALAAYRQASAAVPTESLYYEAAALVLLKMGTPDAAAEELLGYRSSTGDRGGAELHSLLGRAHWAAGRLEAAAPELEMAFTLRAGRDAEAQAEDLRSLAAIYYGLGDAASGGLALRDAVQQGNLLRLLAGNSLLWLLLLILLAAGHLLAESRANPTRSLEPTEGPRPWSVAQVYGVGLTSLLLGLVAVIAYSILVLDNYAAVFTPLQSADVHAVFIIVFSVTSVLGAWLITARHGFDAPAKLLGGSRHLVTGFGLGLLLLILIIAWMQFVPAGILKAPWSFSFNRLTPLVMVAFVVLPFAELYFRAFVIPPFEQRYGSGMALFLSAALFALVLGTPVLLLLVIGIILGQAFRSTGSGLLTLTAQLTVAAGLLVLNAAIPWVGALFG